MKIRNLLILAVLLSQFVIADETDANDKQAEIYSPLVDAPLHMYLASEVKLTFDKKKIKGSDASLISLEYNNKPFEVAYADIATLADEFTGTEDIRVSGRGETVNTQSILADFNAMVKESPDYLPPVLELIDEELTDNQANIKNEQKLNIPLSEDIKLSCATGGGCSLYNYLSKPGGYIKLASSDIDNFGKNNIDAYMAGHTIALNTALKAKNEGDLKLAYAYEAFADHFLINLFSSSRLRIPRQELFDWCFNGHAKLNTDEVSILTDEMLDREAQTGLLITTYSGDKWMAYDAEYVFTQKNAEARQKALQTLQQSVDQIYKVYKTKFNIAQMLTIIHKQLPDIDKISADPKNPPALFKMTNHKLMEYDADTKKYQILHCANAKKRYLTER
jgi:uncharacterized protein YukE